jgi:hypothetical protein
MKYIFFSLLISPSFANYNWAYAEKIAAETRCNDRFFQRADRSKACILGVTAFGEARGWQGSNVTRNQAQTRCQSLCEGSGNLSNYCQNGCQFGKAEDQ